jgi:sugar/nucleoside kinase (ribokinase family)
VANVLAYLGTHGHSVAVEGAVGADFSGELVVDDLQRRGVRTTNVKRLDGYYTRVVFIVTNGSSSHQVHVKRPPLATCRWSEISELPADAILLIGRFNKTVLQLCRRHKARGGRVVVHIGSAPRWNTELDTLGPILEVSDVAAFSAVAIRGIHGGFAAAPSRLTVVYGGINNVQARTPSGLNTNVEHEQYVAVSDPTGMMDCFCGALLSFLIRTEWRLDDDDITKSAVGFANEIAGFCGTGVGARHFPLSAQDEFARARYWDLIQRRNAVFVSHSSTDATLISGLRRRLANEPGTKVRSGSTTRTPVRPSGRLCPRL